MISPTAQSMSLSSGFFKDDNKLILSVDDEPSILLTRQSILENAGYAVLSAYDGDQALSYFAAQPIDLVLPDFVMPGMDGGVVCQEMKKLRPEVPVVMVSGNQVAEDRLRCVDCFLPKGEGPAVLLREIARFLAPPLPTTGEVKELTSTVRGFVRWRKRNGSHRS
jgi:two-component system alkaline phosphatase synthesis response regulator PhoP